MNGTRTHARLLMIREGRYEEALPPLARATELRPDVARFQNNLGIALERTGHLVEAAQAFRAALEADPGYEKARVSLERVEARVAATTTSPTPLDLIALAGAFSAEIERWKQEASEPQGVESENTPGVTGQEG
ncbi:MAG TPA: tetratricopeptide repeat protein [Longimicrobiales bacterium]